MSTAPSSLTQRLIGLAIRVYRRTPLYPSWGATFARWLHRIQGRRRAGAFVHDVGPGRMRLDLSRVIDAQLYYTGSFEPESEAVIRALVRPGDVAFDIGANVGYLTLHLARAVGPAGRVFAFEPTRDAHARLVDNLALNPELPVTAERLALGEATATGVPATIESAYRLDGGAERAKETIDIITLDEYAGRHGLTRLDFVKLDTDGHELAVLRGGERTLARLRPRLFVEIAPDHLTRSGASVGEVLERLKSWNYEFLQADTLQPFTDLLGTLRRIAPDMSLNLVAVPR